MSTTPTSGKPSSTEAPRERDRLAQRVGLGGGDHDEGGLRRQQQRADRLRPVGEALVHAVEAGQEVADVAQELGRR